MELAKDPQPIRYTMGRPLFAALGSTIFRELAQPAREIKYIIPQPKLADAQGVLCLSIEIVRFRLTQAEIQTKPTTPTTALAQLLALPTPYSMDKPACV